MKSSLFETLPKNVAINRKKIKNKNYENNENTNSSIDSLEEKEFLKTKKLNLQNNPKFQKFLQNSNNKEEFIKESEKFQTPNVNNNDDEDNNNFNKEKKNQFTSNFSIDILRKENFNTTNKLTNLNENFMKTDNINRYFNIGQADNFSILNSYDSLLNTHQKFTNDFFAESNVSFKNSFLKNMRNKTSFRNMKIIKNSFSQSSIHMNDYAGEDSKSNFNFYRNSMENLNINNFDKRKTNTIFKSNTNYNQYNNLNLYYRNNKNKEIFDIDEEKDYEEQPKNKTLNKVILNHLNKESFTQKLSDQTLNKKKFKLELNLDNLKNQRIQSLDRREMGSQSNENFINNIILQNEIPFHERICEGFEFFPSDKLTEKSTEYKVVTEIIENIKLKPDNNEQNINFNSSNYSNHFNNNELLVENLEKAEEKYNKLSIENSPPNLFKKNQKFEKESPRKENYGNDIQNRNNSLLFERNSSDDLIKRIRSNNNYKVEDLIMQRVTDRNDKGTHTKSLYESVDSKDSLFETKILKFNRKVVINNSSKKKNNGLNSSPLLKREKSDDGIAITKIPSFNSRYQIHQNYNLSIINRIERVKNNEYLPLNKNLATSLPDIVYSGKKLPSKEKNLIYAENFDYKKRRELKSHDTYNTEVKNKLFEENKKIPEFCIINYENQNLILKNKLEYTRTKFNEYSRAKPIKPPSRNERFELKELLGNSTEKAERKIDHNNLNLRRKSSLSNKFYGNYGKNDLDKQENKTFKSIFEEGNKESDEKQEKETLKKAISQKLAKVGAEIVQKKKPEMSNNLNYSHDRIFSYKNCVDKNHFKAQNHAVIKAFAEVQKENLEIIEKKINDYVQEYNKRFVDLSFKKRKDGFVETTEYRDNLQKMREEILNLNP